MNINVKKIFEMYFLREQSWNHFLREQVRKYIFWESSLENVFFWGSNLKKLFFERTILKMYLFREQFQKKKIQMYFLMEQHRKVPFPEIKKKFDSRTLQVPSWNIIIFLRKKLRVEFFKLKFHFPKYNSFFFGKK